jgi:UDP-N-acetylmuramoyl-tripeptide--D-alanyl-D-alanine ligase
MLELGDDSEQLHQRLLAQAISLDLDLVVATGLFASGSLEKKGARRTKGRGIVSVADPYTAYKKIRDEINGDEVVLLKASRGVNLEKLIPYFESDFGMEGISQDRVEI